MALPWVRMDVNMPSHDKILALICDPSPDRWQAVASYPFSIMWAGGHGTDGLIPKAALPFVHGTTKTARLLVTYGLWREEGVTGWRVVNFAERNQLEAITAAKNEGRRIASEKGNCVRWHGPGCWTNGHCSRV